MCLFYLIQGRERWLGIKSVLVPYTAKQGLSDVA